MLSKALSFLRQILRWGLTQSLEYLERITIPSPKLGVLLGSFETQTVETARASVKCHNG